MLITSRLSARAARGERRGYLWEERLLVGELEERLLVGEERLLVRLLVYNIQGGIA